MKKSLLLLPMAFILVLAGCASVSVQKGAENSASKMPQKIYVAAFNVNHAEFKVDREGGELTTFKGNLQAMMQAGMVADLSHRLILAVPMNDVQGSQPASGWLIEGEFTKINQGSRLLRGAIGLGAGGTKVETRVYVYDLSQNTKAPFLTFSTTGGSGAEPGAISGIATDPVEMAVGAVLSSGGGVAHGLTEDTARTAREITAELSDYMYRNGWIPKEEWIKPKNLDE